MEIQSGHSELSFMLHAENERMVKCAWFRQYLIASFQNSVRKVQTRAISSNVAGEDVDDPCLPTGTGKSHLYSCHLIVWLRIRH